MVLFHPWTWELVGWPGAGYVACHTRGSLSRLSSMLRIILFRSGGHRHQRVMMWWRMIVHCVARSCCGGLSLRQGTSISFGAPLLAVFTNLSNFFFFTPISVDFWCFFCSFTTGFRGRGAVAEGGLLIGKGATAKATEEAVICEQPVGTRLHQCQRKRHYQTCQLS